MSDSELRKNFDLIASPDGTVTKENFIVLCRACGQMMTPSEATAVEGGVGNKVTFDEFKAQMGKGKFGPSPVDLMDSLLAFDGNESGYLSKREIVNLLTSLGEPMTLEQANFVFTKFAVADDGSVNIKDFHEYLLGPAPRIDPSQLAEEAKSLMAQWSSE